MSANGRIVVRLGHDVQYRKRSLLDLPAQQLRTRECLSIGQGHLEPNGTHPSNITWTCLPCPSYLEPIHQYPIRCPPPPCSSFSVWGWPLTVSAHLHSCGDLETLRKVEGREEAPGVPSSSIIHSLVVLRLQRSISSICIVPVVFQRDT